MQKPSPFKSKTVFLVIVIYWEARVLEVFNQRAANAFQSWPTTPFLFEFWTLAVEEIWKKIQGFFSDTSKWKIWNLYVNNKCLSQYIAIGK